MYEREKNERIMYAFLVLCYNRQNSKGGTVMKWLLLLWLIWLIYLGMEQAQTRRARKTLLHIIHVNGTRGKSTVSRLIAAGLRAGGISVFCKTTGTTPMIIDVYGQEQPIYRRGKANIKEQIAILRKASKQGAQVLVVECMAVRPELQQAAQSSILKADIGVITNVRRDHTDVMGTTLNEIAWALSNTVPRDGVIFTGENIHYEPIQRHAKQLGCDFHLIVPRGDEPDFDFPDNIALSLAVCEYLGVARECALQGMRKYCKDPYALSVHRLGDALFINGLSVNDIQSTQTVYERVSQHFSLTEKELILIVNNRADRGTRTQDMLALCRALNPQQVWLLGTAQGYMIMGLHRWLPQVQIRTLKSCKEIDPECLNQNQVLFAIGNIANQGRKLMDFVRERGEQIV